MSPVTRPPAAPAPARFPAPAAPPPRPTRVLHDWRPEDPAFWTETGQRVARRNLVLSVLALFLAFAVWMVWSVVAAQLPRAGFRLTTEQLFWLAALPGLTGATLRIFYGFMVPVFGGRRLTALATASLLLPAIGIGVQVQDPTTPFWVLAGLAALSGLGGANFASSMTNISFFYPKARKGTALGLNAGLGNLGVSAVQLLAPLVVAVGLFGALGGAPQVVQQGGQVKQLWLQNASFLWVPLIIVSAVAAWFGMNDVAGAKASFREQSVIFRRGHTWLIAWLYTGTFGSFIGYSAGLALLTQASFPTVNAAAYVWIGPLVGALARPVGGWLADRLGGARVTLAAFLVMVAGALGAMAALPGPGRSGSFPAFLWAFIVLFLASGIGNGSVYRMIPVVFSSWHARRAGGAPEAVAFAQKRALQETGAVVGFVSAVAAYGAFLVPKAFGTSLRLTGSPGAALWTFVVAYLSCLVIVWWFYARPDAELPA